MRSIKKAGFTIVEVLIAASILLYATWAFYSIYVVAASEAVHSQMLYMADFTGDSLLEEVEAHQYARTPPASWGFKGTQLVGEWQTLSYDVIVDGKTVNTEFHIQWNLENGSFVGLSGQLTDRVSVVISWREGEGEDPDYGPFAKTYFKDDNRHLVVQVPVWK